MAYPPSIPPNNRTNDTDMVNVHASDHNAIVDALNQMPWGYARAPVSGFLNTPTGIINGASQPIPGLSNIVFPALATRRYRIDVLANVAHTAANAVAIIYIKDGSGTLRRIVTYTSPLGGYSTMARGSYEGVFTAGAHTINCDLNNMSAGTLGMDNNDASSLYITDVGPA